jgi:hypothetical protein
LAVNLQDHIWLTTERQSARGLLLEHKQWESRNRLTFEAASSNPSKVWCLRSDLCVVAALVGQLVLNVSQQLARWNDTGRADATLIGAPQLSEHGIVHELVLGRVRVVLGEVHATQGTAAVQVFETPQKYIFCSFLTALTQLAIQLPQVTLGEGVSTFIHPASFPHLPQQGARGRSRVHSRVSIHLIHPVFSQ